MEGEQNLLKCEPLLERHEPDMLKSEPELPVLEGQRFCGVEDKDRGEVFFPKLSNSCHCDLLLQFVPIVPFQFQKLSDAMYLDDKEEGMATFREVFAFINMPRTDPDRPETVRS